MLYYTQFPHQYKEIIVMNYKLPPGYIMKQGAHILAPGYSGGIFTYINHLPVMVPLSIDDEGTRFKVSDAWEDIPTVEPFRLLVTSPDGKQWCVGLLGLSAGGIQLEIIRPHLYDHQAVERSRRIFKKNGSYYIPAGSLFGIQVEHVGTKYQLNVVVSTEGNHFSLDGKEWIPIPDKTNKLQLIMYIQGKNWIIGYIYFERKKRIELQVVSPMEILPVKSV